MPGIAALRGGLLADGRGEPVVRVRTSRRGGHEVRDALTFTLAWPLMVIPTALTVLLGGSVYCAWVFATLHIIGMGVCFWFRFRGGKWKTMRVIEAAPTS